LSTAADLQQWSLATLKQLHENPKVSFKQHQTSTCNHFNALLLPKGSYDGL